ncbi:MAG TPA: ATP-dependent DNA helicase RecG [Mycobacteriales bacterium]
MQTDTPLRKALGDKTAKALADGLGLHTVADLLHHFPRRYAKRGEHTDLGALVVGEDVTVMAQVQQVSRRPMRQRKGTMLQVVVGDGRRSLTLAFFSAWQGKDLEPGRWGLFAGKVQRFRDTWQLNHPQYQLVDGEQAGEVEEFAGALIPVYPATGTVTTWQVAKCVKTVLDVVTVPQDPLPDELRAAHGLVDLDTALREIHRPPTDEALAAATERLTWDEAFALQVTLAQRRHAAAASPSIARPPRADGILAAFDAVLPFALTEGQRDVGETLAAELADAHPMHRLLQGEVGSGKTVCALRAMLQVVDAGGQAALLAPTEVLAAQHARSLRALLGPLAQGGELGAAQEATRVALLTGSQGAAARRQALAEAASGEAGIVVGTHALIQEGVEFADLGLVVVDEQHRFGVEQRDALRAKGRQPPHVLVMTATPIPRTVAMTVFGDLETSELSQLPAGRSPIASHVVPVSDKPHFLDRAWQRVREEVGKGHQAYVVCPRIGDDAKADPDEEPPAGEDEADRRPPLAVLDVAPMLVEGPLAGLRLGILHGRLPADEKDAVMRDFAAGRLDVLVATTVVEVGVDVPNATAMVITDADRFGVSQLHQLRGRVGRGSAPGLCLLVTDAPGGTAARARLDAVASTTDGFALSRLDLEQRREGDVLGAAQSGRQSRLRLLSLLRDAALIETARAEATRLVAADPDLAAHPALAATVAAMVDADRAEYLEKG